jgi:hypothetical protein
MISVFEEGEDVEEGTTVLFSDWDSPYANSEEHLSSLEVKSASAADFPEFDVQFSISGNGDETDLLVESSISSTLCSKPSHAATQSAEQDPFNVHHAIQTIDSAINRVSGPNKTFVASSSELTETNNLTEVLIVASSFATPDPSIGKCEVLDTISMTTNPEVESTTISSSQSSHVAIPSESKELCLSRSVATNDLCSETLKTGLLWKRSRNKQFFARVFGLKNWKERIFVLKKEGECKWLRYYKPEDDSLILAIGKILINDAFVRKVSEDKSFGKKYVFEVVTADQEVILFSANNEEDFELWTHAIEQLANK